MAHNIILWYNSLLSQQLVVFTMRNRSKDRIHITWRMPTDIYFKIEHVAQAEDRSFSSVLEDKVRFSLNHESAGKVKCQDKQT